MRQTVAILPGIVSGSHTTRGLRESLRKAGYTLTNNLTKADIILAHSAGCLWVPQTARHQKLVLVDPPYWPGKTIRERIRTRSRSNLHFREYGVSLPLWLGRQWWGVYYAILNPRRTRYILRHIAAYDLEHTIQSNEVVLVRNQQDDWLSPDLTRLQRLSPQLKVITVPGEHDDFNYHPERYVALLQSLGETTTDA